MSLDIDLYLEDESVYETNITHNLGQMAAYAGIYKHLWRPCELNIRTAGQLIDPLRLGLQKLKDNPEQCKGFNASNGWGTYDQFVPWVEEYLNACIENPEATIYTSS